MQRFSALLPGPEKIRPGKGYLRVDAGAACRITGENAAWAMTLVKYLFGGLLEKNENAPCTLSVTEDASIGVSGAYCLEIGERISIRASGKEGLACALQTLFSIGRKTEAGMEFPCCKIEDAPFKPQRGVHFYMPPADLVDDFLHLLDALASLKYNMIILETGGGVELDRHPEINAAWKRFCREAREYPGGPQGLQASEAYWKDSTHVELCGSGCISKADVRRIIDHCAMLGIEIVPEIQALSHAYYLTLAHREIAERPYERWPDSYCPSCEESYQLYFDVAEELLDLFQPRRVSIGHDEVRVLGECPKCREKSGHDLLAYDINRLWDFYQKRGIQIMMWGEMLQNHINWKGVPSGGIGVPKQKDAYGRPYQLPATYEAAGKISRDILMIDWQYSMANDTENEFAQKGFQEIFGNFRGSQICGWERRSRNENVLGAEVSTWCVPNAYELGFNGWLYELVFSAMVLWRQDYTDEKRAEFDRLTADYLPLLQEKLSGERCFDGSLSTLAQMAVVPGEKKKIGYRCGSIREDAARAAYAGGLTPLKDGEELIIEGRAQSIIFFHAARQPLPQRITTWNFRDRAERIAAQYMIRYEDGLSINCPVEFGAAGDYGVALGDFSGKSGFEMPSAYGDAPSDIDNQNTVDEDHMQPSPLVNPKDPWRGAALAACRYAELDTVDGSCILYACEWKNPCPERRLQSIGVRQEEASPVEACLFAAALTNE